MAVQKIQYPAKSRGDLWQASEANELNGWLQEKKAFGDYLKIRVHGTDGLSALKTAEEFSDILTEEEIAFLKANSEKSDYFLQACRWTVRGLRPEEAIRKVQVDAEIASKRS